MNKIFPTDRKALKTSCCGLFLLLLPSLGFAIDTPTNPRGNLVADGTVQWEWDWVPEAARYDILLNDEYVASSQDPNYTSQNLPAGDYVLTVRAIDSSWNYSSPSLGHRLNVASSTSSAAANTTNTGTVNVAAPPPAVNDNGLIDPLTWTKEGLLGGEWQLTFSDEFDANALNPNRWHGQLRWDGEWNGERYEYRIINGESQIYSNPISPDSDQLNNLVPQHNPFEFDGSRLAIRAVRNPLRENDFGIDHGSLDEVARQQHFISGAISTYDKFYQKYGRFEARIKIPSHDGTFPAFWLYHQNRRWEGTQRTEIDIMENLGHAPQFIYNTFHYNTGVTESYSGNSNIVRPSPDGQIFTGTDYSLDYHTYAVEWSPGYVAWFIDDNLVSELYNENVDYESLYLILNLAMGGNWANFPTNAGGLGRPADERYPASYDLESHANPALEIDYVRVYSR